MALHSFWDFWDKFPPVQRVPFNISLSVGLLVGEFHVFICLEKHLFHFHI